MGWVKLDDCFSEHPKVERAGDLAAWLYVCGLQYSSRALSDGFIPETRLPKLTGLKNVGRLADTLVEVGLWDRVEDGFHIHDYVEHQRTAEQVKRERTAAAERAARARASREKSRRDSKRTNGVSNGDVTSADTEKSR